MGLDTKTDWLADRSSVVSDYDFDLDLRVSSETEFEGLRR
jgi:hypothetical protein